MIALLEWAYLLIGSRPSPWFLTLIAILVSAWAFVRARRTKEKGRRIRLGIRGEKAVAEKLDELKSRGYRVFHDIEGEGFNVDHVIVGPAGVFVIETKARSKPKGRRAEVMYDGEQIVVDGMVPDRDPLDQVRACARFVGGRMRAVTQKETLIRPVVLFPEWWVWDGPRGADVWVLNPDRFLGFLGHETQRLSTYEVGRLAAVISDLARRPSHAGR
ncbi:MAG: nuclease-related domain-containing protein [Planctomycetota bacterium]